MSAATDVNGSSERYTADALPASSRRLRESVTSFAEGHGVSGAALSDLRLATSEAISNAIVHAYPRRRTPGAVTVTVDIDRSGGSVTVMDAGVGTMARSDSPGAGLGLVIIGEVSDVLTIAPGPDGRGTAVTFSATKWAAVQPSW